MIDTHAHVHFDAFAADRAAVLTRAFALGLDALIEVNLDASGWPAVRRLAHADPRIFATLGIHPHAAGAGAVDALHRLARELPDRRVVALGETGLDGAKGYCPLEEQRLLFGAHIRLARETGLPLVIHCREAFAETLALLDREGGGEVRGVFHCFSGGAPEVAAVCARGFAIGLGGSVTRAPETWAAILAAAPRAALLLETDAPFQRPRPAGRGRNEPAFVFVTAQVLAPLLDLSVDALEVLTDRNATRLFRLPHAPAAEDERVGGGA